MTETFYPCSKVDEVTGLPCQDRVQEGFSHTQHHYKEDGFAYHWIDPPKSKGQILADPAATGYGGAAWGH